jgi:two-component system, OmpR family, sensor histidine kinase KdpD
MSPDVPRPPRSRPPDSPLVHTSDSSKTLSRLLVPYARDLLPIVISLVIVGAMTVVASVVIGRNDVTNVVILFLFAIAAVSIRFGHRAAVAAAIGSALCVDYYFLPPFHSFALEKGRDIVTFSGMFLTALFLSSVHERLRKQATLARQSERRTESLYGLARALIDASSVELVCTRGAEKVEEAARASVSILLREAGTISRAYGSAGAAVLDTEDLPVADWAATHLEPAGLGTRNHPTATASYVPLVSGRGCVGVVSIRPRQAEAVPATWARPTSLVPSMARQIALALERALLAEEKQKAVVEAETERTRSDVLSSVSHDLRTPLAVVTSASSALLEHGDRLASKARSEMYKMIHDEARRLNDLLKSLLDVTRLQGGNLHINREWESLEEVIGSVLRRVEEQTVDRRVRTSVPGDLPLVQIDATLIEQLLLNLIDNAFKHSMSDQSVEIDARLKDKEVLVSVVDHGRGVHADELEHIFDKFYRNEKVVSAGLGLGLTIARGIVQAHSGQIWAAHTPGGGLTIHFTLPSGSPPQLAGMESFDDEERQEPA